MNLFISDAWAQGDAAGGGLLGLLPFVLIIVVLYFIFFSFARNRSDKNSTVKWWPTSKKVMRW